MVLHQKRRRGLRLLSLIDDRSPVPAVGERKLVFEFEVDQLLDGFELTVLIEQPVNQLGVRLDLLALLSDVRETNAENGSKVVHQSQPIHIDLGIQINIHCVLLRLLNKHVKFSNQGSHAELSRNFTFYNFRLGRSSLQSGVTLRD